MGTICADTVVPCRAPAHRADIRRLELRGSYTLPRTNHAITAAVLPLSGDFGLLTRLCGLFCGSEECSGTRRRVGSAHLWRCCVAWEPRRPTGDGQCDLQREFWADRKISPRQRQTLSQQRVAVRGSVWQCAAASDGT